MFWFLIVVDSALGTPRAVGLQFSDAFVIFIGPLRAY